MRLLILLFAFAATTANAQTTLLWSETAGTGTSSQKSFVAVDMIGNIYMASSVNGTYGLDWKISSWRPDSVSRWTYTFNGTGNLDDIPAAIVVDSAFNVYVTGTTKSTGSNDIRITKLDSAGTFKWGANYNRTGSAQDVATGLAVRGANLWICGYSQQTTSNYDYTLLKYDTAGTFAWFKHADGTGSGDDYAYALAVKANGDAFITGSAVVTGGTRDMRTARIDAAGTVQWSKYYGNTAGQNDYGNTIGINTDGDVIVGGQSYVTSTNSNCITIKYAASNGAQTWAASYAGSYGGHDAGVSLAIDASDYIYITGYAQTGSANYDYVTIRYQSNGTLSWAQTYNGPGNGIDQAVQIIQDGTDVVITGASAGSGTGMDVCTISLLKSSGSVNWTMRYHSTAENAFSLARDEMGNIVIALNETGGSSFVSSCLKYQQKVKNEFAIKRYLEVLATGFSDLANDSVFKRVIWYNVVRAFGDSIYVMYVDDLRELGDAAGINATSRINAKIANTYGWSVGYDWTKMIINQFWNEQGRIKPLMGVPMLYNYNKSSFVSSVPEIAFAHTEPMFPIGCVTCSDNTLDSIDVYSKSAWVFMINVYPYVYYPAKRPFPIINCVLGTGLNYPFICEVCPAASVGSFPLTTFAGTGHHEFGIVVDIGDVNYWCADQFLDANSGDDYAWWDLYPYNFGYLRALNGVYWRKYSPTTGTGYTTIFRHRGNHLIDFMGVISDSMLPYQSSNTITLCSFNAAEFHEYGESTPRYSIDLGGIYQVSTPAVTALPPMYFYIPPFYGMTFLGAPDMNYKFGGIDNQNNCGNGNQSFSPDHEIFNSMPGYFSDSLIGFANPYDKYATSDLGALQGYWMDNAIVVGVSNNMGGGVNLNVIEFFADTTGSSCDPLQLPDIGNQIGRLECFSGSEFEIVDSLSISTAIGDSIIVHVEATFANGETIDQCQYIVVNSNIPYAAAMMVCIRGDIDDYATSPVNYRITFFETVP